MNENGIVQFSLLTQLCLTLCNSMNYNTPGFPFHHQLPELAQTHVHRVSDATQPSHPLSSPSPPAFNLSQHQGLFHWVNFLHQVAKVLEFQLQHQSFHWIFRTGFLYDWLVWPPCSPGTLESLLQHHSSKASFLQCSAFFMVQLSHPYMTTGKTIVLIRWTFASKVISLLFNMLSRFVIWSHYFMANRWGDSGNSDRLYFWGLQNHCRWWLQQQALKNTCSLEEKLRPTKRTY